MTKRPLCPRHTDQHLLWETFGKIRLYREVDGRKVYRAMCPVCGPVEIDGGSAS